jgi:hypothetical protein
LFSSPGCPGLLTRRDVDGKQPSKTTKVLAQNNKSFGPTSPGSRERFFFFVFVFVFVIFVIVFVIVYVTDNVDVRALCLVPQRFRRVASVDVDAALPGGPTLIRRFFFKPWPARTSAV